MGVNVVTVERTFDSPPTSRLTTATITPASVWGERKPGYWVIDANGNGGAIAVNRLVAAGAAPSWTAIPIEAGGFRYEAGSIVVPYVKTAETTVATIARELGLRVDGVKGKVPLNLRPIGRARVALYKPWTENIDEGWTRWLLDQYEFQYVTITDADIRAGNLRATIRCDHPAQFVAGPSGVGLSARCRAGGILGWHDAGRPRGDQDIRANRWHADLLVAIERSGDRGVRVADSRCRA